MTTTLLGEYRARIEAGPLRADLKEKVLRVLSKDNFTLEDADLVRSLIQQDIDADFATIDGLEEAVAKNPGYLASLAQMEQALADVSEATESSLATLAQQEAVLKQAQADVSEAGRQQEISAIQERLGMP